MFALLRLSQAKRASAKWQWTWADFLPGSTVKLEQQEHPAQQVWLEQPARELLSNYHSRIGAPQDQKQFPIAASRLRAESQSPWAQARSRRRHWPAVRFQA